MQLFSALPTQTNTIPVWNGNATGSPALDFLALLLNQVQTSSESIDLADAAADTPGFGIANKESGEDGMVDDEPQRETPKNRTASEQQALPLVVDPRLLPAPPPRPIEIRIPEAGTEHRDADNVADAPLLADRDTKEVDPESERERERQTRATRNPQDVRVPDFNWSQATGQPSEFSAGNSKSSVVESRVPGSELVPDQRVAPHTNQLPAGPVEAGKSDQTPVPAPAATPQPVALSMRLTYSDPHAEPTRTGDERLVRRASAGTLDTAGAASVDRVAKIAGKAEQKLRPMLDRLQSFDTTEPPAQNSSEARRVHASRWTVDSHPLSGNESNAGTETSGRGSDNHDASPPQAIDRKPRKREDTTGLIDSPSVEHSIAKAPTHDITAPVSAAPVKSGSEPAPKIDAPVATRPAPPPDADTPKSAPLRELTLKVPASADRAIDIHVLENKGKVHVEVRTADAHLASSLRDNVGDLVGKLDRSGYQAEEVNTHNDGTTIHSVDGPRQPSGDSGRGSGAEHDPMAGQGGHPGQHQHQHGQGRGNRPRWLEEIVRNFDPAMQDKENHD